MLGNSHQPAMASFVAFLYTVCIFPTFVTVESQITTVFSNPVKNFPLQNIEFDPQTDAFYVSAKNVLYKFNQEDFNEKLKNKTGPQVGCESEPGKSCDDHNSVMVVTPTGLITCSTSHNGRCIRRSKKNFNNISPNVTNIALVSDVDASAVGIFLNISVKNNALYRYKSIILFAKQYSIIQKSLQKLDRSAIFSISPTLSGKDFSAVLREVDIFDFFLKMKSSIMDYRVVIENEEFVFLLVNQDSQAKLVKICKSIEGGAYPKRVYEDIPITCSGTDGTNYTYVVHGTFVSDSEKRYLVALFSTPSSPATSAVCAYSEQEIYTAYLKSRKDRFECPNHDLQDREQIFEGVLSNFNIPKCVNMSEDEQLTGIFHALQNGNFCNDVSAPVFGSIIGLLPLEGTAVYTTTSQVTVIGSTVINDLITLYIGTQNGIVLKVYLDPVGSMSNELERVRLKTSKIKAIKVMKDQTLYFMSEDKIFKYSPEKRCEDFLGNCTSCVMARDSKCGWCIDTQSCTEKANCSRKNFWLPSARNQCLKLELGDERTYLLDLESGLIQMINISFVPVFEIQPEMKCYIDDKPLQRVANNQHLICEINLGDGYFLKSSPGNVSLSVQMNGHILAATDLLLYKCSNYTSCSQCVGGLTSCYWCTKDAKCKRSRGDCTKSEGGDNVTQCPQVDKHIEMIPNGVSRDLEFGAKNLPDNFTYLCHVEGRQYHAEKVGGSLKCKAVKEVYAGKEDIIKRRVQFTYGPANPNVSLETLEGNAELSVYKCENLSPTKKDCSTCQYLKEEQNYECRWCKASGCVVDDSLSDQQCPTAEPCGTPIVTGISPPNGPIGGGTEVSISGYNFGVNKSSRSVLIAGVECKNTKLKSRSITCETGETSPKSGKVTVTVNGQSSTDDVFFIYQEPLIEDIHPYKTIKSGGRTITITGKNLSTGNMNYGVNFIPRNLQGQKKIKCNVDKKISKNGVIVCRPNGANITGFYSLEVTFDGKTIRNFSSQLFEYLKDPEITGTDPSELKSINSGGTSFTVLGKGFTDALETLYVETGNNEESRASCRRKSDEVINCKFPGRAGLNRRRRKRATQATVVIHLDRFTETLSDSVLYVDDPKLDAFQQNQTYAFDPDKHDSILLLGSQLAVVTSKEDYFVLVGSGECAVTSLNNNNLTCRPPSRKPEPRLQEDRLYVRIRVGNLNNVVGIIEYVEDPPIMYIIIGVLGFLLIACLIAGVFIHRRIRTHNQKVIQSMMSEMHELEQNTMQTNQEEFAEMQLNITDIKRDLVSTGIPYHSYQNYSQYMLFPKEVEAGTMLSFLQHSGYSSKNVEKAMDQFEKLMSNKYFVKSLIGTLEKQRKITLIDKAQFSANFSVVMVGKMRDFFDIVNCLLSTLVDSAHKKQHKTLFNRFESITLRLLSHWLSISIYPYLKEGGGSSLFMLYKSTQAVVEKRPVDEVTGEAKNTLSEENFLREKIDCQTMKLEIDLNGNGNLYTCEVLDCDTINQVKSKCLYQIYKNKPASEMPTIDEVDLEWMAGKSGRLTLSNIDQTSERGDGMVRRNTLKHYHVLDGSRMALLYRFSPDDEQEDVYVNQRSPSDVEITIPANVQLIQSVSTTGSLENLRQWHLVKNVEEEESHEKNIKLKDIVKTSHITNLMHTKLVLQDNIKEVFDSVLNHETVPLVVHYLFGVLENLANKNGVEPETLLCWKSESYAMRVWATLLVRPEFLFDIQKVKHVEPCLDVIKQVFIDCFHSTKISKDSSLQKLLFAQEVPHYQKRTEQFYKALANKAAVTDSDFWSEMSRLNTLQQEHLKFSKPAALQKLYKFVQQYMEEIIEDLDEGPETSGLQFGKKLDEIIRQMETDS